MNNTEIFFFESPNQKAKTILLMAGVHPIEEAGIKCLNQFVYGSKWVNNSREFNLIIVPCRNVVGYNVLGKLFNDDGIIAGRLIADNKSMQLYKLEGDYYVVPKHEAHSNNDTQWASIISSLNEHVNEGFVNILSRTQDLNIRANTYYYKCKRLIDLNNIGMIPERKGIKEVGQIILDYRPDYIIDLHEGKDNNNYVYVTDGAVNIGKAIIKEYDARGLAIREYAEDRVAIDRGIYAFEALNSYKSWKSYLNDSEVIIIESGGNRELAKRVESLNIGIEACLEYIENNNDHK